MSDDLSLFQISEHAWIHVSIDEISGFGRVSSNGLIYVQDGNAFLFDTPSSDYQTSELVTCLMDSLHTWITAFVPNHWHQDCLGGLNFLKSVGIKSYANHKTIEIASLKHLPVPDVNFTDSLDLMAGNIALKCYYLGEAHTVDNIVVWIPSDRILFAGCMVKAMNAGSLGNIVDGNIAAWPNTLDEVIRKFRTAKIVIPGHGEWGGTELLWHTRQLLESKQKTN